MNLYEHLSTEQLRAAMIQRVKLETRGKIEAEYPLWKQGNIRDECIADGAPSAEWRAMVQFIDDKRQKSNEVESQIASMTDEQLRTLAEADSVVP